MARLSTNHKIINISCVDDCFSYSLVIYRTEWLSIVLCRMIVRGGLDVAVG